jgi:hypothetical protein
MAAARALLGIQRTLSAREATAARADDGALLRSQFGENVPWLETRPARLADIRPFTPANVLEWAAELEGREVATTGPGATATVPDPPFLRAPAKGAVEAEPKTRIGTTAREHPETPFELMANAPGGGPDIRAGIQALTGRKLGDVSRLLAERLSQSRRERGLAQEAQPATSVEDTTSLLAASGEVWYIANRLYLLDRKGHIVRGDFAVALEGTNLAPGATYFYTPVGVKDPKYEAEAGGLIRVDQGLQISPPAPILSALTVLSKLALVERARGMGGFAIIVSSNFGKDAGRLKGPLDLNTDNLLKAVHRSIDYLPHAISTEILERSLNWGWEIAGELAGIGAEWAAKRVPVVGVVLGLKEAAELGAWLGTTASMAGHAQSEDEIDIAAQAIARKLAGWLVDKAKSGLKDLAQAGFGKGAKAIKDKMEAGGKAAGPPAGGGKAAGEEPPAKTVAPPVEQAPKAEAKAKQMAAAPPEGVVDEAPAKKPQAAVVHEEPKKPTGAPAEAKALEPKTAPQEPPPKAAGGKEGPAKQAQQEPVKQPAEPVKDWETLSKTERAKRQTPSGTPVDEDTLEMARTDPRPVEKRMEGLRKMSKGELEQHLQQNPDDLLAQHALKEKGGPEAVALPRVKPKVKNEGWDVLDPKADRPVADPQVDDLSKKVAAGLGSKKPIPMPKDRVIQAPWSGKFPDRKRKGKYTSKSASAGWKRDARQFWRLWYKQFGDDAKLIGPGRTVTPALAKKWGWPPSAIGQPLEHHHLGNGPYVIPLPKNWHDFDVHAKAEVIGD